MAARTCDSALMVSRRLPLESMYANALSGSFARSEVRSRAMIRATIPVPTDAEFAELPARPGRLGHPARRGQRQVDLVATNGRGGEPIALEGSHDRLHVGSG